MMASRPGETAGLCDDPSEKGSTCCVAHKWLPCRGFLPKILKKKNELTNRRREKETLPTTTFAMKRICKLKK
jgi:hypothetical protein